MSERQEGFWWVRWPEAGPWEVGCVRDGQLLAYGLHTTWRLDDATIEWGPYLGTAPDPKRARMAKMAELLDPDGECFNDDPRKAST